MKVLDYILTVQRGSLVASFSSLFVLLVLMFSTNPLESKALIYFGFVLLFVFLTSFFILLSFFWSFSVQQVMIGVKQVNLLLARSAVLALSVIVYLAAVLTGQDSVYILVFLLVFLGFYLVYSYQLD